MSTLRIEDDSDQIKVPANALLPAFVEPLAG